MHSSETIQPSTLTTQAWTRKQGKLQLVNVPLPPQSEYDVTIDIRAIGLCRTDFYAIAQEIPTKSDPLIPCHESAGVISGLGEQVQDLSVGDRVAINPIMGCGECAVCQDEKQNCPFAKMIGVDFDGTCTERIVLPASNVYKIPQTFAFENAVFAEPVAATLGVINSSILPDQNGIILGNNRITELTLRVLRAKGFTNVNSCSLNNAAQLGSSEFDFVVETEASKSVLDEALRLIQPRGIIVLKSRQHDPVPIKFRDFIPKEPRLEFVNYGSFEEAVELLTSQKVAVDDLVGQRFSLKDFQLALSSSTTCEDKKTFVIL